MCNLEHLVTHNYLFSCNICQPLLPAQYAVTVIIYSEHSYRNKLRMIGIPPNCLN